MIKKIILLLVLTIILATSVVGCSKYDYSTIKTIQIRSKEKSDLLLVKFKEDGMDASIKTKDNLYSSKFEKVDKTQDNRGIKMTDNGYIEADFNDIKLNKNESTIIVSISGKNYNIKINSDNIKDGILQLKADTKKLTLLSGFDIGKYQISNVK